jgi:2-dehydro-3-deoxy-D-gluconate 5-dehydrogenase
MNEIFSLNGKVAIVTGGDRGLGKALIDAFASQGADCVIAARDKTEIETAAEEFKGKYGVRVLGLGVDIVQEDSINLMVQRTMEDLGRIDILVNNAGAGEEPNPPQNMSVSEWDRILNTNLRGPFLCSKAVYPQMKAIGGGKIINIGSMTSIFGSARFPAYASSKGGIVQLTKSLAVAWAKDNIQVNAILPGWFITRMGEKETQDPEHLSRIASVTPAGRWGETKDLVGAGIFLASHAADFITGIVLPVDGGYSAVLNGMDGPFIFQPKPLK